MFSSISNHISVHIVLATIGALLTAIAAFWAAIENAKFEKELRKKSEEIADLNKKIAGTVTGGDSYCYLVFSLDDRSRNNALLVLIQNGDDPLYDLSIRIVDLEKFRKIKNVTMSSMKKLKQS